MPRFTFTVTQHLVRETEVTVEADTIEQAYGDGLDRAKADEFPWSVQDSETEVKNEGDYEEEETEDEEEKRLAAEAQDEAEADERRMEQDDQD